MADIKAKVAALISESQLAFNVGAKDGVKKGDRVLMHRRVDVKDPDTKEPLGSVLVPKLNLEVNHVQDRLCIARVTDTVRAPDDDRPFANIFGKAGFKQLTLNPGLEDYKTVSVQIGEAALVRSAPPPPEEPPF